MLKVLQGTYFTAETPDNVTSNQEALIVINDDGTIDQIVQPNDASYHQLQAMAQQQGKLVVCGPQQVILPGFVDLHLHAPQWPQAGLALDRPLANWLNDYTFPLEAKFANSAYAKLVYRDLVHEILRNGTTTVLFFGSIHLTANLILAQECLAQGLRSAIGKVVMDNPDQTPAYYRDASSSQAIEATITFIQQLRQLGQGSPIAPIPVITPRFVPACQPATLRRLGALAAQEDLLIQSHLSESIWEHQYAIDHYQQHDAAVLDQAGLLTDKAIMAHASQLTATDEQLVLKRQTAIAHCPISNAFFANGTLATKRLMEQGVKLGLGSDISGGYSISIYDNLRQAVMSSQMRTDGVTNLDHGEPQSRITMLNAFYLATVGGGSALHLPIGRLEPGYQADLQIVNERFSNPNDNPTERLERLLYQTHAEDIDRVMVNGQFV